MLLVAVATVPASIVGGIAYQSQRSLILANAQNTVAMAARDRRQALVHQLRRHRARDTHFVVSVIGPACHDSVDRAACLRPLLASFVETEGATAAVLTVPGLSPIAVGTPRGLMTVSLEPAQLAAFRGGGGPFPSYVTVGATEAGRVVVERKLEVVQDIFDDRFGLGESGETFLADASGYFLTAPRYTSESGHSHPIDARPMVRCLAGENATMVAGDYRPVEVVHAFQYLPEIGGGCIMAHVDYAEATRPVVALRNRAAAVAVGFGLVALVVAWVLGWLISKPLRALVGYARTIEAGRFDEPPPTAGGSRELTSLSQALDSMARSLRSTLLLEHERAGRQEAERGERRMRLLADTSAALSSSLEQERVLGRVAGLASEALAARCIVYLRGEDGDLRAVGEPSSSELEHAVSQNLAGAADTFAKPLVCVPLATPRFELGALVFVREADGAPEFLAPELELGREVGRRIVMALENERLFRESREAISLRDTFISVASHELRTPLTALRLRLRGLRGPRGERPEEVIRALDSIDRQVTRLAELIENLLDVSRISSGRMNLELAEVDLSTVVKEVGARFRDALAQAGCSLTLHADTSVLGRWDGLRLDQVVTNLLSNALKYGPGHPIEVRVEHDEHEARLVVTDHGIGIPKEDQARIFERFGRAVPEQRYPGLGLGLWIVTEIVSALQGSIEVKSEVGHGSTFTVHLPFGRTTA